MLPGGFCGNGGDEFLAFIFPEDYTLTVAEKICENQTIKEKVCFPVSISYGIATYGELAADSDCKES